MLELSLFIGYFSLIFLIIFKCRFFRELPFSSIFVTGIYILKLLGGIAVLWVYSHYYSDRLSSDILKYFDDGKAIFHAFQTGAYSDYFKMITGINETDPKLMKYYENTNFWFKDFNYNLYNDNRTIIRFNAIALIFSHGSIMIHTLFISFLSFIGGVSIFKVFYPFFKAKRIELLFAVFLVPSVVFWTSGVLKEGLLMFGLGIFILSIYRLSNKLFNLRTMALLAVGSFILFIVKFYVLVALLPGVVIFFWLKKSKQFALTKFLIVHLIFAIIIAINPVEKYNLIEIITQKQHDFINMVEAAGNVNSYYQIPYLEPTVWSILKNIPTAIINSLLRPFPHDLHSLIMIPPFFENIGLLGLFILIFGFRNKLLENFLPYFYFSVSFLLILLSLVGLTTPVIGALVRYKVPALPFLFILIFYFLDTHKLFKKLQKK
ncbi:MAG TPA: hypothetical protein EYP69_00500 [Bacteroidales bacterium]|nr:hypothetical protein [Bacteroidales bacterium]